MLNLFYPSDSRRKKGGDEQGRARLRSLVGRHCFPRYFAALKDPAQQAEVICPLNGVLLMCLLAVLTGAGTFADIALFGEKKLHLLRHFLPYRTMERRLMTALVEVSRCPMPKPSCVASRNCR